MHPYKTIRFTEAPDLGDIKSEGRASHVGVSLGGKNSRGRGNDFRRTSRSVRKTRRYLKRSDKARLANEGFDD